MYGAFYCYRAPHWVGGLVKTVSTASLGLLALLSGFPVLAVALGLSSLGDLALSRQGERWFMGGLISFALAHAVYIFLLFGAGWPPVLIIAALGGLAASTRWWLLPYTAELHVPVAVYVLLITGMGLAAWGHDSWLLRIGATLFIASDVTLAWHLFRAKGNMPARQVALWALYYTGQVALMMGLGQFL
ncbi:YhhN-like protein [Litoreibacter janthinus]|uniref:YhhN-like protein n=1 Tax=Litoreibacter janthinus TaxID=670154 RepID=A0A1I6HEC2_9RHOB|nr:YhhN-like protein [Litoreibacter janthinus]